MTATAQYLSELDAELARAGIHRVRRKRIIAEFADHLRCDPAVDLGDPVALAVQFADDSARASHGQPHSERSSPWHSLVS